MLVITVSIKIEWEKNPHTLSPIQLPVYISIVSIYMFGFENHYLFLYSISMLSERRHFTDFWFFDSSLSDKSEFK